MRLTKSIKTLAAATVVAIMAVPGAMAQEYTFKLHHLLGAKAPAQTQMLEPWAGAVLAKIIVLVFIILFIQKRPRGLFPQKGRAAEG